MPDISIALSAKDNFSDTLKKIANETRTSVKDIDALQKNLNKLNQTRATLKLDLSKAKKELREAEKRFKETGDAADELAVKDKQLALDNISSQLKAVSASAKTAEKDILSLSGTTSKINNRGHSGRGGGIEATPQSSILKGLSSAGMGQILGDSLSGAAHTLIGSAFGDELGNSVSSVIGGAASGAALGSMMGPVGTAIGAGLGAIAGGINAASDNFAKRDEAFKSYVQGQVDDVFAKREQMRTEGSSISAQRETDVVSFSTLFGDKDIAQDYLDQMKTMANTTPFLYGDLTAMSKTLKTFGYSADQMVSTLTKVGDAGAALGMSVADMNITATALGRMKSSNKASLEELNMLQDRGIDAIGAIAEAKGVSKGETYKMISAGDIAGTDAVAVIESYMEKMYQGAMEQQSKTFAGLSSTLEGYNQEMQNAMGEGYNEGKKIGMSNQIDWLGGESGQKMQEVYKQMGTLQSDLENMQEEMSRNIFDGMFSGNIAAGMDEQLAAQVQSMHERYLAAMKTVSDTAASNEESIAARAELGALMGEAQALAESEYYNSEAVGILTEANISMVSSIQSSSAGAYQNAGYALGQQLTRGISSAIASYTPPSIQVPSIQMPSSTYLTGSISSGASRSPMLPGTNRPRASSYLTGGPSAIGVDRVPHDNMLYLLHEGERVLPARDVRAGDRQGGGGVVLNMNGTYNVRQNSDIDAIAEQVAARILEAQRISRY